MKFCFKLVKKATETSEMSKVGFGGQMMVSGAMAVEDARRSGHPSMNTKECQ